jgi:hypothetical protein
MAVHLAAPGRTRMFLVSPARSADEPRLWCIRVTICTTTGEPDFSQPTLTTRCSLTHQEMMTTFNALREDATSWMAEAEQAAIATWLATHDAPAPPVSEESAPGSVAAPPASSQNHKGGS